LTGFLHCALETCWQQFGQFLNDFLHDFLYENLSCLYENLKGGPEPLEKESHKFLGSKRDDRFSNPFFEMVPKTCQGSFFVPALA